MSCLHGGDIEMSKKRSKTGCLTCRKRKIKCDENWPVCSKCTIQQFSCDWPAPCAANPWKESSKAIPFCSQAKVPNKNGKLMRSQLRQHAKQDQPYGHLGIRSHMITPSLSLSLTKTHLECANSVSLAPRDQHFLKYFPTTAIYGWYDFGPWSTLQYIIRELAPSSIGVMRMILALSASGMYKKDFGMVSVSNDAAVDPGLDHYNMALKHLHDCLASEHGLGDKESVESMIATIFFMVHYECQFSTSTGSVKAHLKGLWALLISHPLFQESQEKGTKDSSHGGATTDSRLALSCQLILWLLYADVTATSSGASVSLFRLLSNSASPFLKPGHLCRTARIHQSRIWGDRCPPTQVLADMELYRPVEFGQQILALRFDIWHLKTYGMTCDGKSPSASLLLDQILRLREKHSDVLLLSEATATVPWTQTMETTTRIVASYWALLLFHRRMLGNPGPPQDLHRSAVDKVTSLLFSYYHRKLEKRNQGRVIWPTFISAIETHDPIHRGWLTERLREDRNLSVESEWAFSTAEDILAVQSSPGTPWVDLAGYMQSQD